MFRLKVPEFSENPWFLFFDEWPSIFEIIFSNCLEFIFRIVFNVWFLRKDWLIKIWKFKRFFFLVTKSYQSLPISLSNLFRPSKKWLERFLINFSFSTIIGIPVSLRNYQIATNLFFFFFGIIFWWKIRSTFAEKLPRSSREVLICLLTVHRWRKISWNKVDHDPFIFSAWTISTKCHLNSFYLPLSCSIYVAVYFKCLSHERGDQRLSIFRLVESRDKKKQGPRTNGSWTLEMDFQCSWNTSPFHVSMIT